MLNGILALHDVRDVEQFCGRIIGRSRLELSAQDNEDLLAYLIETAWELSLLYDRGDSQYPPRFSVYATNFLGLRVIDWQRARDGRTRWANPNRIRDEERRTRGGNAKRSTVYERAARPTFHPIDDRPDIADTSSAVDVEVGGLSDLIGLLGTRGSAVPRGTNGMGKAPAREAA